MLAHDVNLCGLINSYCVYLPKVGTGLYSCDLYFGLFDLDPRSTKLLFYVMLNNNIKVHTDCTPIISVHCESCLLYVTFTKHFSSILEQKKTINVNDTFSWVGGMCEIACT